MNRRQKLFVEEMIRTGDKNLAYHKAYPKAGTDSCRINSSALLRNPSIAQAVKDGSSQIESLATQEATESLKLEIMGNVLSRNMKREELYKIAKIGEVEDVIRRYEEDPQTGRMVYKEIPIKRRATVLERLKAIELDNKMTGDQLRTLADLYVNPGEETIIRIIRDNKA